MSKAHPIAGKFRITHMDQWDQEFVDAEVPGFVYFDSQGQGEFQFGYVTGQMDCEQTERSGRPAVEWTFEGNDEMDPITGRGWAVLQDDGTLKGKLSIHNGDSSTFTAEKQIKGGKKAKSGRTIRAIDATTGKAIEIEAEKIRPGRIQHADLPESLLMRIRAIHTAVKGLLKKTLEEFEINFMRDSHPEGEVALWERIVVGMQRVHRAMPKLDRKVILKTLLAHSMVVLTKAEQADPVVKKIIRIAEGK